MVHDSKLQEWNSIGISLVHVRRAIRVAVNRSDPTFVDNNYRRNQRSDTRKQAAEFE